MRGSHPRTLTPTPGAHIAHTGYAGCRNSPALQGRGANTLRLRGLSAGFVLAGFSSDVLSFHGIEFCHAEPLNTTPAFCEVL